MYGHTSESLGFPVGLSVPEGAIVAPQFQHFHPQPIPAGVTIFPGQPPVVEAVSSPLLPTTGLPPDVTELLVKARSSWLKGNELVQLLEYGIAGKFPLSAAAADMPPSGTLFLYDRKKVRFFRLDGHNWRKKHDGKTVRETHEKLKVRNRYTRPKSLSPLAQHSGSLPHRLTCPQGLKKCSRGIMKYLYRVQS